MEASRARAVSSERQRANSATKRQAADNLDGDGRTKATGYGDEGESRAESHREAQLGGQARRRPRHP